MALNNPADFFTILRVLREHEVEFILVGGLCAVARGAPIVTMDVDIVHQRTPDNITRLVDALNELDAVYRHHPAHITPQAIHFEGVGHSLWSTKAGHLDVLGTIDEGRGYDELIHFSSRCVLDEHEYHMLTLEELVGIKQRAGRNKDLAVLPVLLNTLKLAREEE